MQKRFLRSAASFPRESRAGSDTSAVLADFYGAVGGEFLEASLQSGGEVHAEAYKANT